MEKRSTDRSRGASTIDSWTARILGVSSATVARGIDRAVAVATSIPPMFSDGWGRHDLLDTLIERLDRREPPTSIEIRWMRTRTWRGLRYMRGYFATPDTSLPLPPRSRTAYVELLLPQRAADAPPPPVCIHLAGTGDPTYIGRRIIASPLARRRGIGAIILQNPFYGERRPSGQRGTKLRRVVDQFLMNVATLVEARSLVKWLREQGVHEVGLTGYSMGGYMAALAAQSLSDELAVVACATGDRVVHPFIYSPLSRLIDWEALERDLPPGESARRRMKRIMGRCAISRHGTLEEPRLAILLGALYDEFVLPEEVARLAGHWSGADLRWMKAGHTTGWLFHRGAIREAIADAFDRLERLR